MSLEEDRDLADQHFQRIWKDISPDLMDELKKAFEQCFYLGMHQTADILISQIKKRDGNEPD